jgi:hypothetical protein
LIQNILKEFREQTNLTTAVDIFRAFGFAVSAVKSVADPKNSAVNAIEITFDDEHARSIFIGFIQVHINSRLGNATANTKDKCYFSGDKGAPLLFEFFGPAMQKQLTQLIPPSRRFSH